MNITVIGACGRTGKLVCSYAVKRGHKVTGLSRNKCQLKGVNFVIGDAKDGLAVKKAIKNADVVISVIGHIKLREAHTQTEAIKVVIKEMKSQNVHRIISLTGSGVRVSGDKISLTDRLLNWPLKIVDRSRVLDGIEHYQALKNTNLNWTILRVLKLSNSDKQQDYKFTAGGPALSLVSRKTVAKALVELAESNDWEGQLPVVTKK